MKRERELRRRRIRKSASTRRKVLRRPGRPRLSVFRSNKYIYAQVIDDSKGATLAAASSREKDLGATSNDGEGDAKNSGKVGVAFGVGQALAQRAKDAGVDKVVFDRRYYKYHGRVKALAEGARKGGLEF